MESITNLTQKGQIIIPKPFRDKFGLKKSSAVRIVASDDHLKVYPVKDILDMAGSIKPVKGRPVSKAREYMESHYKRV